MLITYSLLGVEGLPAVLPCETLDGPTPPFRGPRRNVRRFPTCRVVVDFRHAIVIRDIKIAPSLSVLTEINPKYFAASNPNTNSIVKSVNFRWSNILLARKIDNAPQRSVYLYVGYITTKTAEDVIFDGAPDKVFTRDATPPAATAALHRSTVALSALKKSIECSERDNARMRRGIKCCITERNITDIVFDIKARRSIVMQNLLELCTRMRDVGGEIISGCVPWRFQFHIRRTIFAFIYSHATFIMHTCIICI